MPASSEQSITLAGDLHARPAGRRWRSRPGGSPPRCRSPRAPARSTPRACSASWAWARRAGSRSTVSADGPDAAEAVAALIAILGDATRVGG